MPQLVTRRVHYAWIIVAAAIITSALIGTTRLGFAVLLNPILQEFGWSPGISSVVYTVQYIVFGLISPILGRLADRIGLRRVLFLGAVAFAAGMVLTAGVRSIWHLYLSLGLLVGIGAAAFFAPLQTVVGNWFDKRFGLAFGLIIAAPQVGAMVLAPLLGVLITTTDWVSAFLWSGGISGGLTLLLCFFFFNRPADVGMSPYGYTPGQPSASGHGVDHNEDPQGEVLRFALQTPSFRRLVWVHLLGCVSHAVPLVHVVFFASLSGMSQLGAASVLSMISITAIASRFLSAMAADRFGGRPALMTVLLVQSSAILIPVFTQAHWAFYLFALVFGLGLGGEMTCFPFCNRNLYPRHTHATIYGYEALGAGLGMAGGSLLGGLMYDYLGSYQMAFLAASLIGFAGAAVTASILRHQPVTAESSALARRQPLQDAISGGN